jgi:hypothetical protein
MPLPLADLESSHLRLPSALPLLASDSSNSLPVTVPELFDLFKHLRPRRVELDISLLSSENHLRCGK